MNIYAGQEAGHYPLGRYEGNGYRVRYTGCFQAQVNFGSHDDPRGVLTEGEIYEVDYTVVHGFSTEVYLVGHEDKGFNSVCFEEA